MKNNLRLKFLLLTTVLGILAAFQAHGQMKIGNNPTKIHPASILELESNNQGLRLTQVTDTAEVNKNILQADPDAVTAAEGLVVYQIKDSSIYIRLQNSWHKVLSGKGTQLGFWSTTGNITSADSNYLGTTNSVALNIGTDSSARIIITPSGLVKIVDSLQALHAQIDTVVINDSLQVANVLLVNKDSVHVDGTLYIQDSAVIRSLRSVTGDSAVLTIDPSGMIHKMSIDSLLSRGVQSINGVVGTNIRLRFGSDAGDQYGPWIDSVSGKADSTLILNIPAASGIAGHAVNGIVDSTAQSFAGMKSFGDSVAIGSTATPNATLDVLGNVNMRTAFVEGGTSYNMSAAAADTFRTLIIDVTNISGAFTVTLPAAVDGRIYTIKKVGKSDDNQLGQKVEILPSGGDVYEDNGTSFTIYNNFTAVTLQAKNHKWYIIRP